MSKTFRAWDVDQTWLLPASIHEFVPADHLSHFVRDTVREGLDLSAILSTYFEDRGYPPFHPGMMTALLLYGYAQGVYSSRKLARACEERVDFMAVTGMNRPDFRTINQFRLRHLKALEGLFVQVLQLCQAAGLVGLGHVAADGTKLKANASRHKAMSYGRMKQTQIELQRQVSEWMRKAKVADELDDVRHGPEHRGDETPAWMADKQQRLERIRKARAELEAEAAEHPDDRDPDGPGPSSGMQDRGRPRRAEDGGPPPNAQRNFTDPDCRIQPTRDGYIAGYNGQIAVDADHQIIVAQRLATNPADFAALIPLVDQAKDNLGRKLKLISGDSGFANEANLAALKDRRIRAYLAPNRKARRDFKKSPLMAAMADKLRRAGRASPYRLRKQVVEPVFGHIKHARGFRQFLLRGFQKTKAEWSLICTAHNLLKLARATG